MPAKRNKKGVIYWSKTIDGVRVKRENKNWKSLKQANDDYKQYLIKNEQDKIKITNIKYLDLVDRYIDYISLSRKQSTIYTLKNQLINVVGNILGNINVKSIDVKRINKLQKELRDKDYSNAYLYKIQTSLKGLLNYAVTFDYIKQNPFDKIHYVKSHNAKPKLKQVILTKKQFDNFLSVIDDPIYYALFSVLYWNGLRIGELMALKIKDYDPVEGTLNIYQTFDNKNRILTSTKTEETREVLVPNMCILELDILLELYSLGVDTELNGNNYLFKYTDRIGQTTIDTHRRNYIKQAQKKGLDVPYFTNHDLRHTHASTLISLGIKPLEIANRLGHTVAVLLKTYAHLFEDDRSNAVNALNKL